MRRTLQILLPFLVLIVFGFVIWRILESKVEPQTRRFAPSSPEVTVRELKKEDFQITLHSQGAVRARTQSSLIPEVRGRIVSVSPNFQEGAFFEEGDVLLEIDDRDYLTELTVAQSALAQAELALQQEAARYDQARRDWERLNPDTEASELTLREPQIRQARAAVASAEARVDTAQLNLERTKVSAPYAGRILTKNVDVGQYVSTGNQLASIYAVDFAEVRLPLTASQISYLNLPTIYRGANPSIENGPKVTLSTNGSSESYNWEGRIVRSEGAVDERTRQIFVVAQIEDPYGKSVPGRPPLKVGTFVQAEIEGTTLHDVFVLPRSVYRENSFVLTIDDEKYLNRRPVELVWENDENVIVKSGLAEGDMLCLTDVPYALENGQVVAKLELPAGQTEQMLASSAEPERARRPASSGGSGSYPDLILEKLGGKLPTHLKDELIGVKMSMDFQKMRPLVQKIGEWASENGEEMPPNPTGGSPRS